MGSLTGARVELWPGRPDAFILKSSGSATVEPPIEIVAISGLSELLEMCLDRGLMHDVARFLRRSMHLFLICNVSKLFRRSRRAVIRMHSRFTKCSQHFHPAPVIRSSWGNVFFKTLDYLDILAMKGSIFLMHFAAIYSHMAANGQLNGVSLQDQNAGA